MDAARALLERAIEDRIFPAATAEAGDSRGILWRTAAGALTFDAGALPADNSTIFDLASLTKPIATTSATCSCRSRRFDFSNRCYVFAEWRARLERAPLCSIAGAFGGAGVAVIDRPPHGRRVIEHDIALCA